jgi:hypothetical protein
MVRFVAARSRAVAVIIAAAVAAVLLVLASQSPAAHTALAQGSDFCGSSGGAPIVVKPTMAPSFVFHQGVDFRAGQARADCEAWQQFVYMNWPAKAGTHGVPDPSRPFGTTNIERTVWVSYDRPENIFVANPAARRAAPAKLTLRATTETLGNDLQFGSITQAGSMGWIVGRKQVRSTDGKLQFSPLTFYDVWVDNDEEDYIWANKLQYAVAQQACAKAKAGFGLPKGSGDTDCAGKPATYGLGIGAVEVKAALLDMGPFPMRDGKPDLAAASKIAPTFFLFPQPVDLVYPPLDKAGGTPIGTQPNRLMGLVGLHIIRKLPGAQRFLWSTFEHVDNAPDKNAPSPGPHTYFDPSSTQPPNVNPAPPPRCPSTGCYYGPSQLVRDTPLDPEAVQANSAFHAEIPASSIFRNYELIDVQWPSLDYALVPGAQKPVDVNFFVPSSGASPTPLPIPRPLANMTLESFRQDTTCLFCHSNAPLAVPVSAPAMLAAHPGGKVFLIAAPRPPLRAGATPPPQKTGAPYGSDFSFIFRDFALQGTPPPKR